MSTSLLRREIVLTSAASAIIVLVTFNLHSIVARYRAAAARTTGFLPIMLVWFAMEERMSIALLETRSSTPAFAEILAMFLNGSVTGGSICISTIKIL